MIFPTANALSVHRDEHKPSNEYKLVQCSLRGVVCLYERTLDAKSVDEVFLDNTSTIQTLEYEVGKKEVMKTFMDLNCVYLKLDHQGEIEDTISTVFRSKTYTVMRMSNLNDFINICRGEIYERVYDFTENSSNWILHRVIRQRISIAKQHKLLRGSCRNTVDVKLLNNKSKYVTNPPNVHKNECFHACIAAYFTKSTEKNTLKQFIKRQIKRIKIGAMPVKLVDTFIAANKHLSINISIILVEGGIYTPVYHNKRSQAKHHIKLLLMFNKTLGDGHYMLIKDYNKLVQHTFRDETGKVRYQQTYHCFNCLCSFYSKDSLNGHIELCNNHNTQKIVLPDESNNHLYFKNIKKTYQVPIFGFLDFEAFLTKTDSCKICNDFGKCQHNTTHLSKHVPFAYSLLIVDINDEIIFTDTYAGDDCVDRLLNTLLDQEEALKDLLELNTPLTMTSHNYELFNLSETCGLCNEPFNSESDKRRHHHHYTGKFISAVHNFCNMQCRAPMFIPIWVHNFSKYDSAFILNSLKRQHNGKDLYIRAMAQNTERVRTLTVNRFRFLDSMDMFHASLASVVEDLVISNHNFPLLAKGKMYRNDRERKLLLGKGIYPYQYGQSISDLILTKNIPDRIFFYSDLTATAISEDDYQHAIECYSTFECENLLDYALLYVKLDVFLLAESLIAFKKTIFESVQLDCNHYLSAAQLGFDIMLKQCGVVFELLTDPTMLDFVESNIRGGVSFVNTRYAEKTEESTIAYLGRYICLC